jgi:beta-barrel assembly-enhancing protease
MVEAVEREFPLLKHKLVNRYVNTLGQSIVSRNPDMPPLPYEFRVLRSNDVLVLSLPGGIIYITLGALRAVELEGQLAAALAHELAHQQLGHPLIVWRRRVNANRGQRYLLDFSGSWSGSFLGENGAIALDKGMEEEADRLAPVLMHRARFDPRLYASYLQMLRKLENASAASVAAMSSLHPPTADRIAWAKEVQVKLPPVRDASVSSSAFQQIKSILQEAARRGSERQGLQMSAFAETLE